MKLEPKRILYVGNHAGYFLSHRLPTFTAFQENGYEVHVIVPKTPDMLQSYISEDAFSDIEKLGFVAHDLPIHRGGLNPVQDILTLKRIIQLYRQLTPDLVYHSTIKPVIYGGIASRIVSVPAVINALTGLGYVFVKADPKTQVLRPFIKQALRYSLNHPNSRVVLQNNDDAQMLLQQNIVNPEIVGVIKGSGVNMEDHQFHPAPNGIPIVLMAARLLWSKGILEFVEAARRVKEKNLKTEFWLIGDIDPDNPQSVTREEVQSWHDEGAIKWLGWRRDVPDLLAQASVVCLPTAYGEGVPKILIEAAATGRAIITTDMPGCREIVQHEKNGLLIPIKDAEALAHAIERLIADPTLRVEMGKRGRQLVEEEFSTAVVTNSIMELTEVLLNKADN